MSKSVFSLSQVASSIPYDNSITGLGTGDTQSAIDSLNSTVASGPAGLSTSASSSTGTTSTTYALLNSMTITVAQSGNYAVIFTGQFVSTNDVNIAVYANGTQQASSIRTATGPSGSHSFIMSTSEKVSVSAGQLIQIYWNSTNATCTGRNITAIKVT